MVSLRDNAAVTLFKEIGALTTSTYRLSQGFSPLLKLLGADPDVTRDDLAEAIDSAFAGLYQHPLLHQTERLTSYLRARRLIPNEESTEDLIRFMVDQAVARSPVQVPEQIVQGFWEFFEELFSTPELKGLGELSLDMVRLVLRTYEPLLVELVNILKAGRRFNQWQLQEVLRRAGTLRKDLLIMRRQLGALRYIKPFFQTDPKDFGAQAQIVAQMVREFGPFFVKMAQVAAANADFLPNEIARELAVFHEDVPPMDEDEVVQAFIECYGKPPHKLYLGFDPANPIKSGSIGSVYLAKKPFVEDGVERLRQVVVKVGRQNIDREFTIGKMVMGLAIMSSQYWAPHSKLAPFLRAMQEQVDEFVAGFVEELDFDAEALHHQRFHQRSLHSRMWRVPQLYGHSRRIIEMEYLSDAESLTRALRQMPLIERRRFQKQISDRLLYTLLNHIFVHHEIHGDLHPGNIMVDRSGSLYLIDWGNVVGLDGKWSAVWDYLAAAVTADTEQLTDALIRVSTQPEVDDARRAEIKAALDETLNKKGVTPLTRRNFIQALRKGGMEGLSVRGQTVLHLMSNTQQIGLVVRRDYVHLSRALFAAAGSFGSLYENDSKRRLLSDVIRSLIRMPLTITQDLLHERVRNVRQRFATALPWQPQVQSPPPPLRTIAPRAAPPPMPSQSLRPPVQR